MTADQPVSTIVNGSESVTILSLKKTNAYPFWGRGGSDGAERKIPKVGTTQKASQITAEKQIVLTIFLTIFMMFIGDRPPWFLCQNDQPPGQPFSLPFPFYADLCLMTFARSSKHYKYLTIGGASCLIHTDQALMSIFFIHKQLWLFDLKPFVPGSSSGLNNRTDSFKYHKCD